MCNHQGVVVLALHFFQRRMFTKCVLTNVFVSTCIYLPSTPPAIFIAQTNNLYTDLTEKSRQLQLTHSDVVCPKKSGQAQSHTNSVISNPPQFRISSCEPYAGSCNSMELARDPLSLHCNRKGKSLFPHVNLQNIKNALIFR
jgi:hypothetical protein